MVGLHSLDENPVALHYFNWLVEQVTGTNYKSRGSSHFRLLNKLHETPFRYTLLMDSNRYEDGISLRYDYGYLRGLPQCEVTTYIDSRDCSVLELMVSLSRKITESIGPSTPSNNPSKWFWMMIDNLKLGSMSDQLYSVRYVETRLDIFMDRQYEYDGHGGLFVVKDPPYDMKRAEIWYQMNWAINEELNI